MKEKTAPASAPAFGKDQLVRSNRFRRYVDALPFLLEDGKAYTIEEVEHIINDWQKGQVK